METNNHSQIYDTGYEPWEGDRSRAVPAWFLIGQSGLRNVVAASGCLGRTIFIVYLVVYYAFIVLATILRHQATNLSKSESLSFLQPFAESLAKFSEASVHSTFIMRPAIGFLMLAMVFYGAQLIAKDKAANGLQVYFSKALDIRDYLLGKFLAVGAIVALVTLVPSLMMIGLGMVFTTEFVSFMREAWYIPLSAGLMWATFTLAFGSFTLFFSSCFTKTYMASVSFLGFMFISSIGSFLMRIIFGSHDLIAGFSWFSSLNNIGDALFRFEVMSTSALFWQCFDLVLICTAFIFFMFRNVRPVEVVK